MFYQTDLGRSLASARPNLFLTEYGSCTSARKAHVLGAEAMLLEETFYVEVLLKL